MKGYDLHDAELKEIFIKGEIENAFKQFEKLMKDKNKELTFENVFIAGYMLANPILREELKKYREKEIKANMSFNQR